MQKASQVCRRLPTWGRLPQGRSASAAAFARASRISACSEAMTWRSSSFSRLPGDSPSSSLSCMCRSQTQAPKRLRSFMVSLSSCTCCFRACFSASGHRRDSCRCSLSSSSLASRTTFSSAHRALSDSTSSTMESTEALPFFAAAEAASLSPQSSASIRHTTEEPLLNEPTSMSLCSSVLRLLTGSSSASAGVQDVSEGYLTTLILVCRASSAQLCSPPCSASDSVLAVRRRMDERLSAPSAAQVQRRRKSPRRSSGPSSSSPAAASAPACWVVSAFRRRPRTPWSSLPRLS
mmetsp:Transcript_115976/g.361278  ORF Transcript_115976/g.361278 Transcript_115976/m.361278 type:complete len:292 (-) Transcript_115976:230-1105(-)